jgi:hypothetical protein
LRTFQLFIDDDRYSVPTLQLFESEDEAAARARARELLAESAHHRGVEVCENGVSLFTCRAQSTSSV